MKLSMIFAVSVMVASPAFAQSTPPSQGSTAGDILKDVAGIVFEEAERHVIEEYYDKLPSATKEDDGDDEAGKGKKAKKKGKGKGRGNGLPPGLAKRDQLPPGLAKRGNQLPPGLMKGDLPPDLENDLPDLPDNVERVIVDTDVLLVEKDTDLILDVIKGVITGQ